MARMEADREHRRKAKSARPQDRRLQTPLAKRRRRLVTCLRDWLIVLLARCDATRIGMILCGACWEIGYEAVVVSSRALRGCSSWSLQ
mmetsp:Transcript_29220/g.95326  ORF Transcript_29220/g.95326 Transcript_29220/m.95326 type:complete len:88 (-) Transcript_29220:312-575(-)